MHTRSILPDRQRFLITVEVVPPAGPDAGATLDALSEIAGLPFDGLSVASNPVAKPRMSALALSTLLQERTGKPAILHCTTRDHNRLSIQSMLWGARALGIRSVLAATGDYVALGERARTTTVRDVDVFSLVSLVRETGLRTGVVLDPHLKSGGLEHQVRRLSKKVAAGAEYAVTQPVYAAEDAEALVTATATLGLPVIMGILPLRTARHAWFLDHKVAGISVPGSVQQRMELAADPVAEGVAMACELLELARQRFAGVCIMPPFDHYEVLHDILT